MRAERVNLVPCSGVGKPYGTVSREAAFEVAEKLRPGLASIVPLSLLVLGDEETRAAAAGAPVIAIDGCTLACASKMTEESGAQPARSFRVMEFYREHRDLKPQGIAQLNEAGEELARLLAESIAHEIDRLLSNEEISSPRGEDGDA